MPFGLWAWMGARNHVLDGNAEVVRDFEWSADRMQILPISCTPGTLPWQPILGLKCYNWLCVNDSD